MIISATYTRVIKIDEEANIDFCFLDCRIYTTNEPIFGSNLDTGENYLCISIEMQLDNFEALDDCMVFARPTLLTCLSVLTFFTQTLFTTSNDSTVSVGSSADSIVRHNNPIFVYSGQDYSENVKKMILFINTVGEKEKSLFFSLIDRYRKAFFLEEESIDNLTYDDEIYLTYFHILELLSAKYYNDYKQIESITVDSINKLIEKKLKKLQKDHPFLDDKALIEVAHKIKVNDKSLNPTSIGVSSKIIFMLKKQKIYTPRVELYINDLISDRNSVAHGREVYQDKKFGALVPFFPIVKEKTYSFDMLRLLTGKLISGFIKINHLKKEWKNISTELLPTFNEVKKFLHSKDYTNLTVEDFISGKKGDITPYILGSYLLEKKFKENEQRLAVEAFSKIIFNYRENEEDIFQIILPVLLIVDEAEGELRKKCIEIINLASSRGWGPIYSMSYTLYYLESLGHNPKTLKELLQGGKIK